MWCCLNSCNKEIVTSGALLYTRMAHCSSQPLYVQTHSQTNTQAFPLFLMTHFPVSVVGLCSTCWRWKLSKISLGWVCNKSAKQNIGFGRFSQPWTIFHDNILRNSLPVYNIKVKWCKTYQYKQKHELVLRSWNEIYSSWSGINSLSCLDFRLMVHTHVASW